MSRRSITSAAWSNRARPIDLTESVERTTRAEPAPERIEDDAAPAVGSSTR